MTVRDHGTDGGRSPSQSKPGSTTRLRGMAGAESLVSGVRSSSSPPVGA
jgi:hypothetical protein